MRPAVPMPAKAPATPTGANKGPGAKPPSTPTAGVKPPSTPTAGSKVPMPNVKAPIPPSQPGGKAIPTKKALVMPSAIPQGDITFGENSYVFIPDAEQSYVPAKVLISFKQGDDVGQVETLDGKKITLSKQQTKECQLMDAQSLETLDNMVELRVLNEASILHNLRMRYYQDEIYTTIGDILVSVNPFKLVGIYTPDVMDMYIRRKTKAPHVYRVADAAFRAMEDSRKPQSCIVAGESGAGKTEATKVFLQYLAEVSARNEKTLSAKGVILSSHESSASDGRHSSLQEKILEANPLLEAFGNAKTVRNDNSSRFGKWIEVSFDAASSTIVGGSITSYLLEKTRVVFVAEAERNYHIFYQLVAGAGLDKSLRTKYCLSNAATDYHYLNQSSCIEVEEINDTRGWHHTQKAMEVVGIGNRAKDVYATLAGILHLGNVHFGSGDTAAVGSGSSDSLDFAAQCLGFQKEDLERALTKRDVSVRGEKIFKDNNPFQAGAQRDGLAKAVYGLLFDWLLNAINQSLRTKVMEEEDAIRRENQALMEAHEKAVEAFKANPKKIGGATGPKPPILKKNKLTQIGVLDIFGFESFTRNSFEQLCINYCNEKLQGHFNSFVFTLEQSLYTAEGLDVSMIEFKDNASIIDALELKKKGIFSILDEEGATPNATDLSLLKKILDVNPELIKKPDINAVRANADMANVFILTHYAGNVAYSVDGFLGKNKDELAPELTSLLECSEREFVLEIHESSIVEESERVKKLEGGNRRQSCAAPDKKKQTLGAKFKEQLALLMNTLNATAPHFVRCIKPNAEKVADIFTTPMILSQLRYSGLLEVCRIRQNGYPVQKSFDDFAFRYAPLCVPPINKRGDYTGVAVALERQQLIPDRNTGMWQMGKTKVFMRQQIFNGLERARDTKLKLQVRNMQRVARGFIVRRQFRRYRQIIQTLKQSHTSNSEAVIEKAILDSGALPYNGIHLTVVQKAHEALSRLRALTKARAMISEAVSGKQLAALEQALRFADEVGLSKEDPTYKQGRETITKITDERAVRDRLRAAVQSRSMSDIVDWLAKIKQCTYINTSQEIAEAESMIARLERIAEVAKQVETIVTGGKATDELADKVMNLVTVLVELGANEHPAVAQGEQFAKRQAEASAAHRKRVAEIKAKIKQVTKLEEVIALEMETMQLGIDKDPDVAPLRELRTKLEQIKEAEANLGTAMSTLVAKSELAEGVNEQDIAQLVTIIQEVSKVIPKDAESLTNANGLVELTRKQIAARKNLEQALQGLKDNPNQADAEGRMKQAVKDAQSLGMQDDTARRGQALLHLKTIAAEEKREMRRRSVMAVSVAHQGAMPGFGKDELEEVPEQPWLLDDDDDEPVAPTALGPPPGLVKLVKQTPQGRAEWISKRMEVANSTEWNEILRASSSDMFRFEGFIGLRSDEDFTEREPSEHKKKRAAGKCVHSKEMLPKSMLKMENEEMNEEALKAFKSILGWSGDQNAQFPQMLALSVLKSGLQFPTLRDEIYTQLLKQLSNNPDKESTDRTWLLVCLCSEYFAPSKEYMRYVVNFLLRYYPDQGMRGNYAKWCAYQLSATDKLGSANFLPDPKDINLYTTRPPVIVRVHQIYQVLFEHMSWTDVPVWPDQDVGTVEKHIANVHHISPELRRVSGLFLKDIDMEPTHQPISRPPPLSPRDESSGSPVPSSRLASNGGEIPATPTGAKKKTLFSIMSRSRLDSASTEDVQDDDQPINAESKRKTITSRLGALGKSFRLRVGVATDDDDESPVNGRASLRMARGKSFKVRKASASPRAAEVAVKSSGTNQFVAVGAASTGMMSYGEGGESKTGNTDITSQQVTRVPPPPFAPWPLPRNFYLGDVFLRLVSQDRLPFLTYQRKLFVNDLVLDKPLYIQIMQDVVNNRLPIQDQYQILDLACVAATRSAVVRKQPLPRTRDELLQLGLLNYIPPNWLYGVHENYWTDAAASYLSTPPGSFILEMDEAKLYERYLAICQQQYLFGASLFSVIHKDLPGDYVAGVNHHGLHLLTNEGSPQYVGIISLQEITKFGASSTFVWINVGEDTVKRLANLFLNEEDRSKCILYLHTQQAREIYSLLIDYMYWSKHGTVKDF